MGYIWIRNVSRFFTAGSTEYLELDSAPVTAAPLTMGGWIKSGSIALNQMVMYLGDKDVNDHFWRLFLAGGSGGDPVRFACQAGGAVANADTSTGFSADTWHHVCGVAVSATDRRVFIDGGSKGTNATSLTPAGADRISIGRHGGSTPFGYFDESIADAAIWNVALSDAEVALWAKGFSPLSIQPQNLAAYWPLIRDDDNDWIGGFDLTAFNTPTVSAHPPLVNIPALI